MERLSAEDARILRLESEAIAGHTMKIAVIESGPGERPVTVERLRERVESRLGGLPRARQRLAPTPLGSLPPSGLTTRVSTSAAHVRARAGAARPTAHALIGFAGKMMAERLDHERPLWCIDVVGPDGDGRTALVIRIHHCLADGVTALRMLSALLWDADDDDEPGSPRPWSPAPAPGKARMLASGVASRLRGPGGALAGGRARGRPRPAAGGEAGRELAALPGTLRRELWPLGADTAFDRRIGGDREVAFTACALEDLKRIEHAVGTGVTVNDVVLPMIAGAIRGWLATHDEPIRGDARPGPGEHAPPRRGRRRARQPRLVPVLRPADLRARPAQAPGGDQRRDPQPQGAPRPGRALLLLPQPLAHPAALPLASELASGPREFALSVSNVPGPREPVRLLGADVTELYSVAEPADRHALRASAVSLAGRMGFGFCTDPGAVPGRRRPRRRPRRVARGARRAFAERQGHRRGAVMGQWTRWRLAPRSPWS